MAATLREELRDPAWGVLGFAYLALLTWGVVSMRSGVFGRAFWHGDPERRHVALTYDDGPTPGATAALLDLLKERDVNATFFVIGKRAREHPDLVRRCAAEGHLVANHSDRHSNWINFFPPPLLRRDLGACQATVLELTGTEPRHYRPPVGLVNPFQFSVSKKMRLTLVGWHVRSFDTLPWSAERVARRVLEHVEPGSIVLLHDGLDADRVVEITTRVLDGMAERRLIPVRLDALVDLEPGPKRTAPK